MTETGPYASIREHAEAVMENPQSLTELALASHFLRLLEVAGQAVESGFTSKAANGVLEMAVGFYRGVTSE